MSGGYVRLPLVQRIAWALVIGAAAATLLLTGGLEALQTAAITTALPFSAIMLLICLSMIVALRGEGTGRTRPGAPAMITSPGQAEQTRPAWASTPADCYQGAIPRRVAAAQRPNDWRRQLNRIITVADRYAQGPSEKTASVRDRFLTYLEQTVLPAFEQLKSQLEANGRTATIERDATEAALTVWRGQQEEFRYGVRGRARTPMVFAFPDVSAEPPEPAIRAEVLINEAPRGEQDPANWDQADIARDFVVAYGKWMGWTLPASRAASTTP
jgi:choline/glycine/proline betaine transport protein